MTLEEFYTAIGGNYQETMQRLPSETMIRKFIHKYPSDPSYASLSAALEAQDWPTAFRAAHTLKGVAQNLGFGILYKTAAALTEALRGPAAPADADWPLWDAVREAQTLTLTSIGALD